MRTLPAACLVLATLTPSGAAADELETLARRLSKPEAARALPAFAAVDTTAALVAEALRPLAAPLPADDAGWAELVDRLREARQEILRRGESIGPAPSAFSDLPLALPSAAAVDGGVRVELDLAPARTLLALLASDATSAAQVEAQLRASESWPVFAALVEHRSQSFYPTPLSIELLALNLALAANTDPLTRLYVAVNPWAFLDLGEVRANLPRYSPWFISWTLAEQRLVARWCAGCNPTCRRTRGSSGAWPWSSPGARMAGPAVTSPGSTSSTSRTTCLACSEC